MASELLRRGLVEPLAEQHSCAASHHAACFDLVGHPWSVDQFGFQSDSSQALVEHVAIGRPRF